MSSSVSWRGIRGVVCLLCLLPLSLTGCGGAARSSSAEVTASATLDTIRVTPASPTLAVGQTQQMTATGSYSDGSTRDLTGSVTWSSSSPTTATIDASGLLTVLAPGSVSISAAYQGVSSPGNGSAVITCVPPAHNLQSIAVTPASAEVLAGQQQQFTAAATYSDGPGALPADLKWAVSDASVASVSASGLVTTAHAGNVVVSATSGGVQGSASLTIDAVPVALTGLALSPAHIYVAPGASQHVTATATYADQSTVDVSDKVSWSTADGKIATVDQNGNLSGVANGATTLTAALSGQTAQAPVTVALVPRFLFTMHQSGRDIARATVDADTGHLRFAGYQETHNYDEAFTCLSADPGQTHVYATAQIFQVAGAVAQSRVSVYTPDPVSGTLTLSPGGIQLFQTPLVGCITFAPNGRFGYAVTQYNATQNGLAILERDETTGLLTLKNTVPLPSEPGGLTIDPQGEYLYATTLAVPQGTQAFAYGYRLDPTTGDLTPIDGTPFAITYTATTMQFDPTGNFMYMLQGGSYGIDEYSVDRATGKLTPLTGNSIRTGINPTGLTYTPDGQFAYATTSEEFGSYVFSSKVVSFAIGSNGQLKQIGEAPTENATPTLVIDPTGRFLYAENPVTTYIDCYRIGADGVASEFARQESQISPSSMIFLSGGAPVSYVTTNAYLATAADSKFSQFSVGADGSLTQQNVLTSILQPFSMSSLPWGTDLLLAGKTSQPNVQPFVLRQGGLAYNNSFFGDAESAGGVAIDPSGQYAFETDSAKGVIYTYIKSNGFWDLLSYLPSNAPPFSSFPAAAGAGPLVTDADGRFLFVADQTANKLNAFEYDGGAPELREVTSALTGSYGDGSPYTLQSSPMALAMGVENRFLYVLTADGVVHVYAEDSGHLALAGTATAGTGGNAIAVVPDSNIFYVTTGVGVSGFSVDAASGSITALPSTGSVSLAGVKGAYVDPSGHILYVTAGDSTAGTVRAYSIATSGALAATGNVTPTGGTPAAMSFSTKIQ